MPNDLAGLTNDLAGLISDLAGWSQVQDGTIALADSQENVDQRHPYLRGGWYPSGGCSGAVVWGECWG